MISKIETSKNSNLKNKILDNFFIFLLEYRKNSQTNCEYRDNFKIEIEDFLTENWKIFLFEIKKQFIIEETNCVKTELINSQQQIIILNYFVLLQIIEFNFICDKEIIIEMINNHLTFFENMTQKDFSDKVIEIIADIFLQLISNKEIYGINNHEICQFCYRFIFTSFSNSSFIFFEKSLEILNSLIFNCNSSDLYEIFCKNDYSMFKILEVILCNSDNKYIFKKLIKVLKDILTLTELFYYGDLKPYFLRLKDLIDRFDITFFEEIGNEIFEIEKIIIENCE